MVGRRAGEGEVAAFLVERVGAGGAGVLLAGVQGAGRVEGLVGVRVGVLAGAPEAADVAWGP